MDFSLLVSVERCEIAHTEDTQLQMRKVGMGRTRARTICNLPLPPLFARNSIGGLDFSTIFVIGSRYTSGIYRVIREDVTYRGIDLSKVSLSEAEIHENRTQYITQSCECLNIKVKK